jgi:hypothetical protein
LNVGLLDLGQNAALRGVLTNTRVGRVRVKSTSQAFEDPVVHDGAEFSIDLGAAVVFRGAVTGKGRFTGGGEIRFARSYSPGPGAAQTSFENPVIFEEGSTLDLELAGPAGAQHDRIDSTQPMTLEDVAISLAGGYVPEAGQEFTLITAPMITYNGEIVFTGLPNNVVVQVNRGETSLSIVVIPEPQALACLLMTSAMHFATRRRRRA